MTADEVTRNAGDSTRDAGDSPLDSHRRVEHPERGAPMRLEGDPVVVLLHQVGCRTPQRSGGLLTVSP